MTDYFALLDELRRPWLDPDALKQSFLNRSATVHPDRVHNLGETERTVAQEQYVQLNAAYRCLREPKDRLRHLLELELGTVPQDVQHIPPDLMDLCLSIGQACVQADTFIAIKAAETSALLKVQLFAHSEEEADKLRRLLHQVSTRRDQLIEALKQLDLEWIAIKVPGSTGRSEFLGRVEELYRLFGYFDRWIGQIQDRIVRLSF